MRIYCYTSLILVSATPSWIPVRGPDSFKIIKITVSLKGDLIEYLDEIETEACLSGAQIGSNHEKNWR